MNRLVRDHYPVARLPEDLRVGFEGDAVVRVTIDIEDHSSPSARTPASDAASATPGLFSSLKQFRCRNFDSDQAVDDYVRGLRDEWTHRER